jgi:PKD repeat protein
MGLLHDGYSGGGYYSGHGSGATGWAPIMGVGYYQSLVQWSKGEYATATNVQDDYVVMASNGLPIRLDDHGDTISGASALQAGSVNGMTTLDGGGVIERPTDVDMFSFSSGAGTISLSVNPAVRSPNLDLRIELRNSAGALLASANPVDALTASLSYVAPVGGTFYLGVQGTGKGDPATTGYGNYGSVGQYLVSGSAPAASGQPPVAQIAAAPLSGTVPLTVSFSGSASSDADGSIVAYEWNFGDGSPVAGGANASHVYNSAGTYSAVLKVTDNSGLTATKSVQIDATSPVVVQTMGVGDIAMSLSFSGGRNARATAGVTVRDSAGRTVPGATVSGSWSGIVSGSASAVSGSNGVATLQSPNTKKTGTFVFTVTCVSLQGYTYQSNLNVETSDSITR